MNAFNLAGFLPYRLSILSQTLSRLIAREYEERFGLTMNQWRAMVIISNQAGITAKGIGEQALLDKMSVSRALKALQGRGLVRSDAAQGDGRKRELTLTKTGMGIYKEVLPIARRYEAQLLGALTEGQKTNLDSVINTLMDVSRDLTVENTAR
jgi:DNA-binding MarR family transcriptional regulator